ncbi:MAG TPA: hypothetical protein VFA89_11495 [Terriglobales bacterium]|nr:hypothetical protein [Terriglobales bacterium]
MKAAIIQDRTGRWIIPHHSALRGLTYTTHKDAAAFLIRVRNAETELETVMRKAVDAARTES